MAQPEFWYLLVLLSFLLMGGAWRVVRPNFSNGVFLLVWLGIIGIIMVVYVLRDELADVPRRLQAEFAGSQGSIQEGGMRYRRDKQGHVVIGTEIAGVEIPMLLDTGATSIMLQKSDAKRIGISPRPEDFNHRVFTASGEELMARIRLKQIKIGSMLLTNVETLISPTDTGVSLLGMSALQYFDVRMVGQYVHIAPK